jgi:hypothetical protein
MRTRIKKDSVRRVGAAILFNGMCWIHPDSEELSDIAWKLRYQPELLSPGDRYNAASALACYREVYANPDRMLDLRRAVKLSKKVKETKNG